LHWVFSFLEVKDKKNLFILYLGYAATFVFLMFSFSPLFVRDVEPIGIFKFWPKAGILYTIYLAYYVILVGYGLIRLLRSYAQTSGIKRSQISFIIFGTILGFVGGATNFLLWYDVMVYPIGNIVVSLYVFMLFYAMAKYRLMDTRIVARKFFVYFCIAAFVYIFFYFLIWFYTHLFGGFFNQISYFIGFIVAPIFVFIFYRVDGAIKDFANRYLFVSLYNYQETINQLIDELTNYIDLNEISDLLVTAIKKSVQSQSIVIFLAETKDNTLKYSKFKIGEFNTTTTGWD
jgi:two-component system nitrogen regulation sensor histidine kinase GlnL